jgi:hypothetical protein
MRSTGRAALIACVPMFAALTLGAVSAAPAFASGKPLVETKAATGVVEKEATLNGVVNPNGAATKYHFEYWLTGEEKKAVKTAEASAGSGTSNVEETAVLTGLKAETVYHFRVVATNSGGTSEGAALEFETTTIPGIEFDKAAYHLEQDKFTLTGGAVGFKNHGGSSYGCSGSSGEGEITGATSAKVSLALTGCGADGTQCTSAGAKAGEIKTGSLPAALRYLSAEKHEAALVLNYHATDFAAWNCAGAEHGIHGSIVVPITVINKSASSYTLKLAEESGQQTPRSFEGAEGKVNASPTLSLIGSLYEEGSVTDTLTLKAGWAFEVKA